MSADAHSVEIDRDCSNEIYLGRFLTACRVGDHGTRRSLGLHAGGYVISWIQRGGVARTKRGIRKQACREHAEKFAKKHGLKMPVRRP